MVCVPVPLHHVAAIGQAVGAVLGRRHMAKHFHISIADDALSFTKNHLSIAAEAALDGIYVVRTTLPVAQSDAASTTVKAKRPSVGREGKRDAVRCLRDRHQTPAAEVWHMP
jgi:hypothetical protein